MAEGEGSDSLSLKASHDRFTPAPHVQFITEALAKATCNTAIFINRGFGGTLESVPPSRYLGLDRIFRAEPSSSSLAMIITTTEPDALFTTLRDSLPASLEPRVVFDTLNTSHVVSDVIARARTEMDRRNAGDLIIVGRSGGSNTNEDVLGGLALAFLENLRGSVLVVQAKR